MPSVSKVWRVASVQPADRDQLLAPAPPLVRQLAWHVHGSGRQGIELEDLMQAGLVALTECALRNSGPGADGLAA